MKSNNTERNNSLMCDSKFVREYIQKNKFVQDIRAKLLKKKKLSPLKK